MSSGERLPLAQAYDLAEALCTLLQPACDLLTIAGSIRRGRETVGDLELVAIPSTRPAGQVGLFGGEGRPVSRLWELVDELVADPLVELHRHPDIVTAAGATRAAPWGDRYRKLRWRGVPVDLFTADADSYGAILLIRTGPPEYSQAWVADLRPAGFVMRGGFVRGLDSDEIVPVRTEAQALRLVGWRWTPPQDRERWKGTETWSNKPALEER